MTTDTSTHRSPSPRSRMAVAGGLALTVAAGLGIFAATMVFGISSVKAGFDGRKSIRQTLSATLASRGPKAAMRQYEHLKAVEPAAYDFDERELSVMGRQLIREKKYEEGLLILHLNAEAYPRSTKVYERLGDAYMEEGDTALAVANYRKSLEMDPQNRCPARRLAKLNVSWR